MTAKVSVYRFDYAPMRPLSFFFTFLVSFLLFRSFFSAWMKRSPVIVSTPDSSVMSASFGSTQGHKNPFQVFQARIS